MVIAGWYMHSISRDGINSPTVHVSHNRLQVIMTIIMSILAFSAIGVIGSKSAIWLDSRVMLGRPSSMLMSTSLVSHSALRVAQYFVLALAEESIKLGALCVGLTIMRKTANFGFDVVPLCLGFSVHELVWNLKVYPCNLPWAEAMLIGYSRPCLHSSFTLFSSAWIFIFAGGNEWGRRFGLGILGLAASLCLHTAYNVLVTDVNALFFIFLFGAHGAVIVGLLMGARSARSGGGAGALGG